MTIARSSTWGRRLVALLVDPRPEVATRQLENLFHLVVAGIGVPVLLFFALLLVGYGALTLAPTDKLGYFLVYSYFPGLDHSLDHRSWNLASWDQVFISPRPYDCDWDTAPLGSKHCHYDRVIQSARTKNENGQLTVSYCVAPSNPLRPCTYDDEKTLQVDEQPAIYVTWQRVEE